LSDWLRERIDPLLLARQIWIDSALAHIHFNPNTVRQYRRSYQHATDGTYMFDLYAIYDLMLPLVARTSFYKPDQPDGDLSGCIDIQYEVGYLSIATVYGTVDLPAGHYPGQRQRFRLPVHATLVRR
jgi:hypothetical protein